MTTSKINWDARLNAEVVVSLVDFQLIFVKELTFNSPNMPFRGKPGYQLVYRPTGHVQAEGVDIVAAVAQTYREQRVLDKVKQQPELLTQDPAEANLAGFFSDTDPSGKAAN